MRSVADINDTIAHTLKLVALVLAGIIAVTLQMGSARGEEARYCIDLRLRDTLPGWTFNPATQKYEQMPVATFKPCAELEREEAA